MTVREKCHSTRTAVRYVLDKIETRMLYYLGWFPRKMEFY